jgi:hypothetical protein
VNNSNTFLLSVNYGTYSINMDFNAQTGAEVDISNSMTSVVISKSLNGIHWVPIFTNDRCVMDCPYSYTDNNATDRAALYRVK